MDVAYLDFSKAFDVVCHDVLLEKLIDLGFDDKVVSWIGDFLRLRSMRVSVEGCLSGAREVTSGVPQGSVLGPVLFLFYVNFLMMDVDCSWKAFADDFKIYTYLSSNDSTPGSSSLQRDLDRIYLTGCALDLRLNPQKCVVMRFGNRTRIPTYQYSLNGRPLLHADSYRDLGVLVDSRLRFHDHVRVTVGKAGGMMNDLLRSTVCRNKDFMVTLFISHIRPMLDYCSCLWNTGYLGDVRLLEALQRRWTREIEGIGHLEYPVRLKEVGMFSIAGRLLRADLIKVWKSFNSEIDVGLSNLFERARYIGTRGHSYKLSVPRCRSDVRRRLLGVRCVEAWNALSAETVEAGTLVKFKRLLERDLGSKLYEFC